MKWRPRAFSRVSTGDSDILSSCDMNDEHAWSLCREIWTFSNQGISGLGSALGRPVVSSVAPSRVSWRPSFLKDAPSQFSLPVIELLLFSSSVVSLCDPWTVVHRLLCPRDFPGKHTGAGCHFLLQGIFCIGAVGKESEGDLLDPGIEVAQCRRHKRCGVHPWDGKTSVEGHGSSP